MTGRTFDLPDTELDREKIAKIITDISDQMTLIEGHQSIIKESKEVLKDEFMLPAKVITAMIKLYHTQKAENFFDEVSDMEQLYAELFTLNDEDS